MTTLRSLLTGRFAASAVVHAALLALLLLVQIPLTGGSSQRTLDADWEAPADSVIDVGSDVEIPVPTSEPQAEPVPDLTSFEALEAPALAEFVPELAIETLVPPTSAPRARAGRATRAAAKPGRAVAGSGTGNRAGDGAFFAVPEPAQSLVIIVDNSRSMNHPHESEYGTRFGRVQAELLRCISQMPDDGRFFVIFFSNDTFPMPARGLQPASPLNKELAARWIATMASTGHGTDPRKAVRMALKLKPDRIYLLTDGEFDKGVNDSLLKIEQRLTGIDTFAFGEDLGGEVLQQLASQNAGTYTFIP